MLLLRRTICLDRPGRQPGVPRDIPQDGKKRLRPDDVGSVDCATNRRCETFAVTGWRRTCRWEEVVEPSIPEGPALLGFVAARIAEEAGGVAAYHAERAKQTEWLAARLQLV